MEDTIKDIEIYKHTNIEQRKQCNDCVNYTRACADGQCAALNGGIKTVQECKGWRTKDGECRAKKTINKVFDDLKKFKGE